MRLLFVTHNIPRHEGDAAGSFVLRLAVALQQAGHAVSVIAPGAPGLPRHDVVEGVAIERVPYAAPDAMTLAYTGTMAEAVRGSWGGRWALLGLLRALRHATLAHLARSRAEGQPVEVIHAHWWFPAALALWGVPRRTRTPLVITMHGSDVRLAAGVRLAHPLLRAVLRQAAARTAVSSWLANQVTRMAPALAVSVAPMPVDTARFTDTDDATPRTGILLVGRLNAQKGVRDMLDALAHPALAGAMLTVVGDGPDGPALMAQAEALGIARRVRWTGAMAQGVLARRYREAKVVAMPSRGEGLGLVAVEAQLSGTPVVAYHDGGVSDVVSPSHGGALVPPGDIAALAGALAAALARDDEDPVQGHRMRGLARAAMLERFSPEAVSARYVDIYRTALAGGAHGYR
jgi:glycosyltransferase involved in cell wall biosynthesis